MNAKATIGQPAPPAMLTDRSGSPWLLADQRGKTVVLIFHRHIH